MEFMECNTYAEDNFVDCVKNIGLDGTETKKIIKFSVFSEHSHTEAEIFETTFDEFESLCREPVQTETKRGRAFSPAIFKNNYRNQENATECSFMAFDLDDLPDDVTAKDVLSSVDDVRSFCYSTYSHKLEGSGSRFRVVIGITEPIPANLYKKITEKFSSNFSKLKGKVDVTGFSPSQYFYLPSCSRERIKNFEFESQEGECFDWRSVGFNDDVYSLIESEVDDEIPYDKIYKGERNKGLFEKARKIVKVVDNEEDFERFLLKYNFNCCVPPLDRYEVLAIVKSVWKYAINNKSSLFERRTLTELSLAEVVYAENKDDVIWIPHWKSWLKFDESNGKWGRIEYYVENLITRQLKKLREEESKLVLQGGVDRSSNIKQIERAEKAKFISGCRDIIKTIQEERLVPSDFDSSPYLVGFSDGNCFDLSKCEARKTERKDYLTKSVNATYDPDATCPLWDKSMIEWCRGDKELVRFLQVWCGYSLSGLAEQQIFLFLYGEGKNGKSVFVNTITELMGQYSISINPETIMNLNKNSRVASGDVARLFGARLVSSTELPEGKRFDEDFVKLLTGGDYITARHLYEREFSFKSTIKLMISGNHKPIVKGNDNGFWRRVSLVPFEAKIVTPNPQLSSDLRRERSGILNWCLNGWIEYQKNGLVVPDSVQKESKVYRDEMDIIKSWMDECVEVKFGEKAFANDLYQSHKKWREVNGFSSITISSFGYKVKNHLGEKKRSSTGYYYSDHKVKKYLFF